MTKTNNQKSNMKRPTLPIRKLWSRFAKHDTLIIGAVLVSNFVFAQNQPLSPVGTSAKEVNDVLSGRAVSIPGFTLLPGGVLEWPSKLRFSYGGGESSALPKSHGLVRAQPGGNLTLQPLGDYKRTAIDLLPTDGRIPEMDAIAEFTLHRIHPTANDQEMISFSALGKAQDHYSIVVEAHGKGQLKPFSFLVVRGGLPANPKQQPFSGEAMQITPEGTTEFGRLRQGGPLKRPVNSITLEQPIPTKAGTYDSDFVRWIGKTHDGTAEHRVSWRSNVRVENQKGQSSFVLQKSLDDGAYANTLEVKSVGELELPNPGSAVVLKSPNGRRWRLSVDDGGNLQVKPTE